MTVQTIPVRELNQNTSAVLARVQTGEELLISVSGKPVARLVPLNRTDDYLLDLVREGRAVEATDRTPFTMPPVIGDPTEDTAARHAEQRAQDERW
jgi:prevent-host-death family protein